MKKICASLVVQLLLFQLSVSSFAQNYKTTLSATYLNAPFSNLYTSGNEMISFGETDKKRQLAYTLKLSKAKFGIKLLKYDASMNLVKENQLFNGERICGPFSSSIQTINDKLWLFYSIYEEDSKNVINLMGANIDPVSLAIGEPKQLLQIDQDNTGLFKSMTLMQKQTFFVKGSPDKSKLLIFWASNMNDQFFMAVLKPDLDLIWNRKETVGLNRTIVNSTCVDNIGNVYTGYNYNSGGDANKSRVSVYVQKGRPVNVEVKMATGHPYDVLMVPSKKGDEVYVTGTYAGHANCLIGIYSQSISTSTFKQNRIVTKEFTPQLIELIAKDSWASTKSKKYGLEPISMQAYELEDGSIGLVGQFRKSNSTEKHVYILSGGIVNVRLKDNDASFSWIPKYRVSAGSTIGDSYYAFPYKDKLLIFYNDEADNIKIPVGEKYSTSNNYKNVVLAVASMDANGTLKREKLVDLANENYLPVGESIMPRSSRCLLVPILKIKGMGGIGAESKWGVIDIE